MNKDLTRENVVSEINRFTSNLGKRLGPNYNVQVVEYQEQQSKFAFQVIVLNSMGTPLDRFNVKMTHSGEFWWS